MLGFLLSLLLFPSGQVDPGLICLILTRAELTFSMICPTVAVQMNGFGFGSRIA